MPSSLSHIYLGRNVPLNNTRDPSLCRTHTKNDKIAPAATPLQIICIKALTQCSVLFIRVIGLIWRDAAVSHAATLQFCLIFLYAAGRCGGRSEQLVCRYELSKRMKERKGTCALGGLFGFLQLASIFTVLCGVSFCGFNIKDKGFQSMYWGIQIRPSMV